MTLNVTNYRNEVISRAPCTLSKSDAEIVYHLHCCVNAGLLEGEVHPGYSLGWKRNNRPLDYFINIVGLTPRGNDYIANGTKLKIRKAVEKMLIDKGLEISTDRLVVAIYAVINNLLGL